MYQCIWVFGVYKTYRSTQEPQVFVLQKLLMWEVTPWYKSCHIYYYTIILAVQVNTSDHSANQWITCFQETGSEILGCSAQELGELREQNSPEYDSVFQRANFRDFIFRVRAKMDTYNVS